VPFCSRKTISVNVPPMSTPTRKPGMWAASIRYL
jgi:hypothetical protein